MNPIENILKDYPILVLDGALATELESRGCNINDSLWSAKVLAENPEIIEKVHYDYFASGADCAITASYQATIEGFMKKGFTREASVELIRNSVKIAKRARDKFWNETSDKADRPYPIIAGSIGPYGAFLADGSEYRGDYKIPEKELVDFHRTRMELLIDEGVDIIACETIPTLLEAKALIKLLKEFPKVYCWISFSARNSFEISDGTPISECAEFLDSFEQVAAIGVNCTNPKYVPELIKSIRENCKKPVIVYPNSGEEYNACTKTWQGETSSDFYGSSARLWYAAGARIIGGCCRTTPEDIRAIAKLRK